jgi:hypothetical protein
VSFGGQAKETIDLKIVVLLRGNRKWNVPVWSHFHSFTIISHCELKSYCMLSSSSLSSIAVKTTYAAYDT